MDAHHNEYLAAATGLAEQTPPPVARNHFAVGDFVSGISAGRPWSGRVQWIADMRERTRTALDAWQRDLGE